MAPKVSILFTFILIFLFVQTHAEPLSLSVSQKASSFKFIADLQGSQKGDKVEGLNELKKYLHHFGYLSDSYKVQSHGDIKDSFDDVLESAIKTYQVNYNLNVTGTLDAETISTMMLPRCGVPDIVDGETNMRSGKGRTTQGHHGNNKKNNHTVSDYSFFPGRPKWPGSRPSLTYGLVNNAGQAQIVNVMNQAFRRWATATSGRFTFRLVSGGTGNIKIGFFVGDHGDGAPFDGPGGVLAHAFAPTDGRLHFDASENYAIGNPGPNQFSLETVAVHEIGHNLGLGHSSDRNAIMFPSISAGQTKNINQDDINGINDLYR